jgi:hypothetical protein
MKIVEPTQITTLLLDFKYSPVGLLTARDAFVCFFNNKMAGFDKDYNLFKEPGDWYNGQPSLFDDQPAMRSSTQTWTIPTIVQTDRKFIYHPRKRKKMTLKQMCEIVNYTCQLCHKKFSYSDLTREHIMPKALKGANDITNLTITCKKCNSKKAHHHPYFDVKGQELKPIEKPVLAGPFLDIENHGRDEWEVFTKKIKST